MFRFSLIAAVATLGLALPANAEEFVLFVYETPTDFAARDDAVRAPAYWGAYAQLAEAMAGAGIVRGGGPLAQPVLGTQVRVRNDGIVTTPVDATREALSGWFVIDVADRTAAEAWAARVPAASTARVEVRKLLDVPMAAGSAAP